jgi:hypothetical protein
MANTSLKTAPTLSKGDSTIFNTSPEPKPASPSKKNKGNQDSKREETRPVDKPYKPSDHPDVVKFVDWIVDICPAKAP